MPERELIYSFIPSELIIPAETNKTQPNGLEVMMRANRVIFEAFVPIGETSFPKNLEDAFHIKQIPDGVLYISKRSYVEDLEGNKIPRTMLVTFQGRELHKNSLGIFSKIDNHKLPERSSKIETVWTKEANYGDVTIVEIDENNSVAVKRYKRFVDGRMLAVRGLEQAEANIELSKILKQANSNFRATEVYFASQDVLIQENVENMLPLDVFLEKNPQLTSKVESDIKNVDAIIRKAFDDTVIPGRYDALVREDDGSIAAAAHKHIFIEKYSRESGEIKYVLIDINY